MLVAVLLASASTHELPQPQENYAAGRSTYSSSVYGVVGTYPPRSAVDGLADTFFHSGRGDNRPWLSIDLGQVVGVTYVRLVARKDCCQDRLEGVEVRVGTSPMRTAADLPSANPLCWKMKRSETYLGGNGKPRREAVWDAVCGGGPLAGNWVTVQNFRKSDKMLQKFLGKDYRTLNLAEVEVYDVPPRPAMPPPIKVPKPPAAPPSPPTPPVVLFHHIGSWAPGYPAYTTPDAAQQAAALPPPRFAYYALDRSQQRSELFSWSWCAAKCTDLLPPAGDGNGSGGGTMVTYVSREEAAYVLAAVLAYRQRAGLATLAGEQSYMPLGATDKLAEGIWQWVDGTPWTFTDWATNQPDNIGGVQNCLLQGVSPGSWIGTAWNDEMCLAAPNDYRLTDMTCVCKQPLQPLAPWPPTPPPPMPWPPSAAKVLLTAWGPNYKPQPPSGGGGGAIDTTGAAYLYYLAQTDIGGPPVRTPWRACRSDCERLYPGSTMLSYGSDAEYRAVTEAVQAWRTAHDIGLQYPDAVQSYLYLGASDDNAGATWRWLDGSPFAFTDWYEHREQDAWWYDDQPEPQDAEHCAAQGLSPNAFPWLKWADVPCEGAPGPYVKDTMCVCKVANK
ncbi:hypothetical protein HXX76_003193 [Chlamydomonas incerta]|uniref:C-type lectin domain-containing protein n=1 Tax=Chlamydomonas incerta TaxID=51695 RepID=A0A835TDA0_CHLIN|nr:hypothetical protein HXX76_003193 [Chlamydomonas incerta]|eukprot:KAG2441572.1 hypothetical protein HXX76_003193 [Chlamydomonas incerta]